jgi:pimeloyl-ACP methyl ester carboxylesterase
MSSVITVEVGPHLAGGTVNHLALEVFLPASLAARPVLFFCIPGGGMNRGYFNLDGGADLPFSFARAMTGAGHVVVTIDPVGVGDSTHPDDAFALTSSVMTELNHQAFIAMRAMEVDGLALGSFPVVGVGHSAGAMLAVLQQTSFGDFDATLLLCFGSGGLPQHFPAEYLEAAAKPDFDRATIVDMARSMFGGDGYMPIRGRPSETPATSALAKAYSATVAPLGAHAMTPGNVRTEMAMLDRPAFLALGGRDMTGPAHLLAKDFEACPDLTVYVIAGAGHHLFVVREAPALYERIACWASGVIPAGA